MERGLIGYALEKTNTKSFILANGSKTKKMDKVSFSIKMEAVMMVNGKIIREKEKD